MNYEFTNNWFEAGVAKLAFEEIIPKINPSRILEIGSYEGASTCYLIEKIGAHKDFEIHCIDTWEGGIEHKDGGGAQADMAAVERRFAHNTQLAKSKIPKKVSLVEHKCFSELGLSKLLAEGKQNYFDFIYVDGSHQAPDVLLDALLSFKLLRVQGFIGFDDYLWQEQLPGGTDPIRCPKIAIDAFTNIYCRKLRVLNLHLPFYQLYIQKLSD